MTLFKGEIIVAICKGSIWTYQHPDMLTFHSQTESEKNINVILCGSIMKNMN